MTKRKPPCKDLLSIQTRARMEVERVTRRYDWSKAKPIPREVIEELMVLSFIRGATWERDRVAVNGNNDRA